MNTYFKYNDKSAHSVEFFAVRCGKSFTSEHATRVPATAKLREMARLSCIPTYKILEDGRLGQI